MKIDSQPLENHQVKLTVELEGDSLEQFKHRAARLVTQETKIPGFRPGKAPYDVVLRVVGEENIENRAIDLLLEDIYPKILEESQIKPSGPGSLEEIISRNPPTFAFVVPLQPEIILSDYKAIRQNYDPQPVSDEEFENLLLTLQKNYARAEPVERKIKDGDLVYFKISGTYVNPDENESAEFLKETTSQAIVNDPQPEASTWPYKGFSNELVGLDVNDEKTIHYTYPEDDDYEKLRGKEVIFKISIQSIKEIHLPELDDEFAHSIGDYESMDDMKTKARERMEKSNRDEYDQKYFAEIVDQIVQQSQIKYPPNVLQEVIDEILEMFKQDLSERKIDMDTYFKVKKTTREEYIATEVKPAAIKRLERSLVLEEIVRQEKLEVGEEELKKEVSDTVSHLFNSPGFEAPKNNRDMQEFANYITMESANRILNERLRDRMIAIASGNGDTPLPSSTGTEETETVVEEAPKETRKRKKAE